MAPCAKSGVGRTRTTTLIADLTMSAKQRLRKRYDACLGLAGQLRPRPISFFLFFSFPKSSWQLTALAGSVGALREAGGPPTRT